MAQGVDEAEERVEDLEWDAEMGLSEESSVAVGLGEDDGGAAAAALDGEAYDEVEDAQSVS